MQAPRLDKLLAFKLALGESMDLGGVLLGAALRVVERLVFSWVERGKSKVKTTDVDAELLKEVRAEADRLRVRVDDLEHETRNVMNQLVAQSDSLAFTKGFTGPALQLRYDPHVAASGKELLAELQARLHDISADLQSPQPAQPDGAVSKKESSPVTDEALRDEPKSTVAPSTSEVKPTSREMLQDLRRRVSEAENPRR